MRAVRAAPSLLALWLVVAFVETSAAAVSKIPGNIKSTRLVREPSKRPPPLPRPKPPVPGKQVPIKQVMPGKQMPVPGKPMQAMPGMQAVPGKQMQVPAKETDVPAPGKRSFTASTSIKVDLSDAQGCVRGERVDRPGIGAPYIAFKGIPFAQPPVGLYRFKDPAFTDLLSTDLMDADHCLLQKKETRCMQLAEPGRVALGSEDCLYLNIYVPGDNEFDVREYRKLPVLFYIHGGGFMYGSSSEAENGPDFFMKLNRTILVTTNYRLGVFGFLNLQDDSAPGNMGLKDQVAALRFVNRNIQHFGGDETKVTIFGNSAGAASVHYHTLSPMSRGLYTRAIMQSGNALAGFAFHPEPFPHDYASHLVAAMKGTNNSTAEILDFLHKASAEDILAGTLAMLNDRAQVMLRVGYPPFCPSVETRSTMQPRFLEKDPEYLVRSQTADDMRPTIIGISGEEGGFALAYTELNTPAKQEDLVALQKDPQFATPINTSPSEETRQLLGLQGRPSTNPAHGAAGSSFGQRIKAAYRLKEAPEVGGLKMLGDVFVVMSTRWLLKMILPRFERPGVPLFLYHFQENGDYNWGKISFNLPFPFATHSDELGYLMRITSPKQFPTQTMDSNPTASTSSRTLHKLVTLWTDFASFQSVFDSFNETEWPRARGSVTEAQYLVVEGGGTRLATGFGGNTSDVWIDTLEEVRRP